MMGSISPSVRVRSSAWKDIVVADSREAMNSEVLSQKQKSTDVINSKGFHEKLIECYDKILLELNPEYAEKRLFTILAPIT